MAVTQGILLSVPTKPLPPTIGTVTANLAQISVPFTQPPNNGGREIISYTAISTPSNFTNTANQSGSGTILFNSLPVGNYTFVVYATSVVGNSDNSSTSNQVTVLGPPTAPTIGTVTVSGVTITVPFSAPANNGGSAILSYTCFSTNNYLSATLNQAGGGNFTFTGVTGTEYIFRIYATNAIGNSPNSADSNSVRLNFSMTVNYILVGGGGGGGGATPGPQYGGGGGGGGVLEGTTTVSFWLNDVFPVEVGAGGSGPGGVGTGGQGTSSSFNGIFAIGGGGGGSWDSYGGAGSGGCGGGGGLGKGNGGEVAGAGTPGQGFAGGAGTNGGDVPHPGATTSASGGGGGGAGAVGQARSSNKGGNGGAGKSTTRGSFSGGGGGSGRTAGSAGSPGGGIGTALTSSMAGSDGGNGSANTGGGGGGGGSNNYEVSPYVGSNGKGGNGGSGKVFVWFPNTNPAAASSPGATYSNSGGNHVYEFNTTGSLIFRSGSGSQTYSSAGTYSWIAPGGVTSVCVVAVGGGGGSVAGIGYNGFNQGAGGGAGVGWKNNISVIPGQSYTVVVGGAGTGGSRWATLSAGGDSYFINTATVKGGGGGAPYGEIWGGLGGSYTGDGGGSGGVGGGSAASFQAAAGGGAGGYTGSGGTGESDRTTQSAGSGGGAGGGATVNEWVSGNRRYFGGGGGGTGLSGQGANGIAGTSNSYSAAGGGGGSGGETGTSGTGGYNTAVGGTGGSYGGGAGGSISAAQAGEISGPAASGAVRIIWGPGRSFPSTNTGDI